MFYQVTDEFQGKGLDGRLGGLVFLYWICEADSGRGDLIEQRDVREQALPVGSAGIDSRVVRASKVGDNRRNAV